MTDNTPTAASERILARDHRSSAPRSKRRRRRVWRSLVLRLPVLLGSLGLSGAWLAAMAWLAAPYQPVLLTAAAVAGGLFVRRCVERPARRVLSAVARG